MGRAIYKNGEYVLDTPDLQPNPKDEVVAPNTVEQVIEPIKENMVDENVEPVSDNVVESADLNVEPVSQEPELEVKKK